MNRFNTKPGNNYVRCIANTKKGAQCRCCAEVGDYCAQHARIRMGKWHRLCALYSMNKRLGTVATYFIRFQKRAGYKDAHGPGKYGNPRSNWRNYRQSSVWPILFHTAEEADLAMECLFTFKNYAGRKVSASIGRKLR